MKHLISVTAVLLSVAACSSDPRSYDDDATGGVSGSPNTGTTAGTSPTAGSQPGTGGGGGNPSTGGSGTVAVAGSSSTPPTGGAAPTAGSSSTGGGSSAGTSTGGTSPGGSATGGVASTGGSGPAASFKCDNLSLAPSMTGVAQPAGAAGGLKVVDWAGFKGAASFTFDDNTPSQMPNYAAIKATGGHVTWFVVGSWLSGSADVSKYKATMADGQEMANHTQSHQSAGSQSDLQQAQDFIKSSFGVNANSMAAPNCADAWSTVAPNIMFQNRGPCGKGIATVSPRDSVSPFKLPAYLPDAGESSSSLSSAITAGKWRIFVIHGFDSQGGTYQPVPIANVTGAMSKAVMDGFWVEGMSNVGAYWQGQKLIPETATTTAMWTLPAKFPPNMCLRITTSGGTVTQKGQTIAWDSHGYYQISLDAGEVTVK